MLKYLASVAAVAALATLVCVAAGAVAGPVAGMAVLLSGPVNYLAYSAWMDHLEHEAE